MLPTSHLRRRANKKSLDEDTPLGIDFSKFEYAIERKILETSLLELCYYTDVVGLVPRASITQPSASDPFDIGNGDIGPEWGVDIAMNDGTLRYGPWADRQRYVGHSILAKQSSKSKSTGENYKEHFSLPFIAIRRKANAYSLVIHGFGPLCVSF